MSARGSVLNCFRSINRVVPSANVLPTALALADEIIENSPDAVQSTKRALLIASRSGSVEEAVVAHISSKESKRAFVSENIQVGRSATYFVHTFSDKAVHGTQEGLRAFNEVSSTAYSCPFLSDK